MPYDLSEQAKLFLKNEFFSNNDNTLYIQRQHYLKFYCCVALRYCRRDASEDYFGHTGAFRCLVEGGGDVAFVKHTTVMENTGGKRREWWVRDALPDDFELLCPDGKFQSICESRDVSIVPFKGTRAEVNEYERCNLGKVMANAVVTRGGYGYNETEINAFINLFVYAQQFYGRKDANEFR